MLARRANGSTEYSAANQTLFSGSVGYAFGDGTIPLEDGPKTHHASWGSTPMYTTHSSSETNVFDDALVVR